MPSFRKKILPALLLTGGATFAGQASAYTVTNTMTFLTGTTLPGGVYGHANTAAATGTYAEDGIIVGVVGDPTDINAHVHSAGPSTNRALEYHTDSSGMYFRKADGSAFSLVSLDYDLGSSTEGGNFAIYGFKNAVNDPMLSAAGSPSPTDPEGGLIPYVASKLIANDGIGGTPKAPVYRTLNVAEAGNAFENISAFWITYQGFNHSPTTNYKALDPVTGAPLYPDFNIHVDNVKLGAAVTPPPATVPVPGAVWLFGTGLAGLMASRRKKATA
ncbi:MAG: PEP-CTERM sorting domain-containing protein [Methylococcaceae bacterium]|nr:PEP-CTERM sorting domain-containing protein [Methylococcaceae bacterium]